MPDFATIIQSPIRFNQAIAGETSFIIKLKSILLDCYLPANYFCICLTWRFSLQLFFSIYEGGKRRGHILKQTVSICNNKTYFPQIWQP